MGKKFFFLHVGVCFRLLIDIGREQARKFQEFSFHFAGLRQMDRVFWPVRFFAERANYRTLTAKGGARSFLPVCLHAQGRGPNTSLIG